MFKVLLGLSCCIVKQPKPSHLEYNLLKCIWCLERRKKMYFSQMRSTILINLTDYVNTDIISSVNLHPSPNYLKAARSGFLCNSNGILNYKL